jgi:cysteine-rich repeat protein
MPIEYRVRIRGFVMTNTGRNQRTWLCKTKRILAIQVIWIGLFIVAEACKEEKTVHERDADTRTVERDSAEADAVADAADANETKVRLFDAGNAEAGTPTIALSMCLSNSPCDGTSTCVGDRQIEDQKTVHCSEVCGLHPCQGTGCKRIGTIRECSIGEICQVGDAGAGDAGSLIAQCVANTGVPFCDEDASIVDDDAGVDPERALGVCRPVTGCGDGKLNWRENCDDGNRENGDGCGSNCSIENGWECYTPGTKCHPISNGDVECTASACQHGATCVERPSGLACRCPEDRTLNECQIIAIESIGFLGDVNRCVANGISRDGSTVVGYVYAVRYLPATRSDTIYLDQRAFMWTRASGAVSMGISADRESEALAVNGDGTVVLFLQAKQNDAYYPDYYLWTSSKVIPLGLSTASWASDLNDDGSVVVGTLHYDTSGGDYDIFRWTQQSGAVNLGHLEVAQDAGFYGLLSRQKSAVSADGNVIVGKSNGNGFRWTQANGLNTLPMGEALDVNADGSVVVGTTRGWFGDVSPVRWTTEHGVETLGSLTAPANVLTYTILKAVNADGSVIVGYTEANNDLSKLSSEYVEPTAWIWDPNHGMRELKSALVEAGIDANGWEFRMATDVSGDGKVVVGNGSVDGRQVCFIARFP